jgi:hypothetical protein
MRTFKSFTREDVKEPVQPWDPRSEGEQRFKHLHNPVNHKNLVPGVTDQDHVFNGGTRKYDPPTASYEKGADVKAYDKTLTREEVESIDEISLKTKINAFKAASDSEADYNYGSKVHAQADRIYGKIVAKHGRAAGDNAKAAAYGKDVYGDRRDNPQKSDPLTKATSSTNKMRITKSGVANKQDQKTNANIIKSRIGKHGKSNIPEANLPPHLAKMFNDKGDFKDPKKNAMYKDIQDKMAKKDLGVDAKDHKSEYSKMRAGMGVDDKATTRKLVGETHLTPVEMKKREEIAKAMGRESPKMDMAKKMAIATAQAKKSEKMNAYRADRDKNMEEEVEQIDEVGNTPKGKAVLKSYVKKALDTGSEKSISNLASRGGYESGKAPYDYEAGHKEDSKSVVRSQGVMNAVKRLTKESRELEEAKRGRPRKNPLPAGSSDKGEEEGGREHIIVQYRKAERMPEKEIEHNDNSKHSFPKAHYKKALDMHLTMKPSEKETFEKRLASSKASALSAVAGEPAPKAKPKITLGGKMQKEAKDLDTKNVKAAVKHDCATHVKHGKFGEGRCVPEMHTIKEISEGVGYVTHYDVLFEHGIEKDVPVESLKILASEEHGHTSKKTMREALVGNQHKIDANHNNKIDKQDFKILKGKEKFKKFSKMKESSEANMQQDSIDRLKSDPLAGTELKKKSKLPPTQGNKAVGGEGSPARVGGKYSMEEESLNNLYNSLSEENQAKFDALIETDPGFEQLLDFARKQGF